MAGESLLEGLVQLKSMVDNVVLEDQPTGGDAGAVALLEAYKRIRAEVRAFVSSLDNEDQVNLSGEEGIHDNPLDLSFEGIFPYLRAERDASEARVELRQLGDWLQHLIDVETLAHQLGGSRNAYKVAHVQVARTWGQPA